MSNTGMQALGMIGAELINKLIELGKVKEDDFLRELKVVKFNWKKHQDNKDTWVEGRLPTGRSGGEIIAGHILNSMDSTRLNLRKILKG